MTNKISNLSNAAQVTEYHTQTINDSLIFNESIVKSLPEFSGESYISWRGAAINSVSVYIEGWMYFGPLTILWNKIVGNANDILTNQGRVLNLEAIFARLDFAHADRRPFHVINQEICVLRQRSKSFIYYYNQVNHKLTLLINKTIMAHGTNLEITKLLKIKTRKTALRTFINCLNYTLKQILFTLTPTDLPNILAKTQKLHPNQMRHNLLWIFQEIIRKLVRKTNLKGIENFKFSK